MSLRSTVYVGNVTYSTQEADLANLFAKCGNVLSVEIKRGYAFVKFDTVIAATSAIQNFNNYIFNGRPIRVSYSKIQPNPRITSPQHNNNVPNNNQSPKPIITSPVLQPIQPQKPVQQRVPYKENAIHVANLPFNITEEQLQSEFESYGILSIHVIRTRNCFAIIELSSFENSTSAIEQKKGLVIDGREIAVTRQIELPERHSNYYHPRGRGGRGRGRGFRRGGFRNDFHQVNRNNFNRNDQFTLTNDLHLHNNINNNLNNVNNSLNNPNVNNNDDNDNDISNDNDNSGGGYPIFHNQNFQSRGNYRGSGYRYSNDIFRGRGNGRGRGRGRGGYRGRGQFRGRSRGRGFIPRGGINEVFSQINSLHPNNAINNPSL